MFQVTLQKKKGVGHPEKLFAFKTYFLNINTFETSFNRFPFSDFVQDSSLRSHK